MTTSPIPTPLLPLLSTPTPKALLTCGLSGSGKSTLARSLVSQYNFIRFSIDGSVLRSHGVYGIDYPRELLEQYQDEAEEEIKGELKSVLKEGKRDVVLDMAFYSKETRDEYRQLIEEYGEGRYEIVVVVFKVQEEELWRRIEERQRGENREGGGEGVHDISRETLRVWGEGFEWPVGEGEVVVGEVVVGDEG